MEKIKNFEGYFIEKNGTVLTTWNRGSGFGKTKIFGKVRILKPGKTNGYKKVSLQVSQGGIRKNCYVHRLVLETFVGGCPEGMQACHNDGDRSNNRLENLRWDFPKNNYADRKRHGTYLVGEAHPMAKLNLEQVKKIRQIKKDTPSISLRKLGEMFGVSLYAIHDILTGKSWSGF